jgi:hypothetical protein
LPGSTDVTRESGLSRRLEVEKLYDSDCTKIKLSYHTEKRTSAYCNSHDKLPSQESDKIPPTRTHFLLYSPTPPQTRDPSRCSRRLRHPHRHSCPNSSTKRLRTRRLRCPRLPFSPNSSTKRSRSRRPLSRPSWDRATAYAELVDFPAP